MANNITRWQPMNEFLTLRDAMDRLFEESFVWPRTWGKREATPGQAWTLPVDAYETKDELVVTAVAPGAKPDDLNIQFQDGRLIIEINLARPVQEGVTYHLQEIAHGVYRREIGLPFAIQPDKVEALLQNGYLTLRLPKAEEVKPRQIKVTAK